MEIGVPIRAGSVLHGLHEALTGLVAFAFAAIVIYSSNPDVEKRFQDQVAAFKSGETQALFDSYLSKFVPGYECRINYSECEEYLMRTNNW